MRNFFRVRSRATVARDPHGGARSHLVRWSEGNTHRMIPSRTQERRVIAGVSLAFPALLTLIRLTFACDLECYRETLLGNTVSPWQNSRRAIFLLRSPVICVTSFLVNSSLTRDVTVVHDIVRVHASFANYRLHRCEPGGRAKQVQRTCYRIIMSPREPRAVGFRRSNSRFEDSFLCWCSGGRQRCMAEDEEEREPSKREIVPPGNASPSLFPRSQFADTRTRFR